MEKTVFSLIKKEKEKIYWNTRMVLLRIPTILKIGEKFSLYISVIDNNGLPDEKFNLPIQFEKNDIVENLPKDYKMSLKDKGLAEIKGLIAKRTGILRIIAKIKYKDKELELISNPSWIMISPKFRIFWGDLHVHSVMGTCSIHMTKNPELAYLYARDVVHHDFLSVTDHLYGITPEKWKLLKLLAKKYNNPGKFVTILGYESSHSSGRGGDINVYFNSDNGAVFPLTREIMRTVNPKITDLWKFLDKNNKKDYLLVPHHTARREKYRDYDDEYYYKSREPIFEIYSMWGSSEKKQNQYAFWRDRSERKSYFQDALMAGCKYGVIASGDDHTTMPMCQVPYTSGPFGSKTNRNIHSGLAAVLAVRNTREDIFEALKNRRCYGTTYEKTIIDFSINTAMQGQTIFIGQRDLDNKKRIIRIRISDVNNKNPMGKVTIIRNNEEISTFNLDTPDNEFNFVDEDIFDKISIKDSKFNSNPFIYYYVRYDKMASNISAWSSPIWFEKR